MAAKNKTVTLATVSRRMWAWARAICLWVKLAPSRVRRAVNEYRALRAARRALWLKTARVLCNRAAGVGKAERDGLDTCEEWIRRSAFVRGLRRGGIACSLLLAALAWTCPVRTTQVNLDTQSDLARLQLAGPWAFGPPAPSVVLGSGPVCGDHLQRVESMGLGILVDDAERDARFCLRADSVALLGLALGTEVAVSGAEGGARALRSGAGPFRGELVFSGAWTLETRSGVEPRSWSGRIEASTPESIVVSAPGDGVVPAALTFPPGSDIVLRDLGIRRVDYWSDIPVRPGAASRVSTIRGGQVSLSEVNRSVSLRQGEHLHLALTEGRGVQVRVGDQVQLTLEGRARAMRLASLESETDLKPTWLEWSYQSRSAALAIVVLGWLWALWSSVLPRIGKLTLGLLLLWPAAGQASGLATGDARPDPDLARQMAERLRRNTLQVEAYWDGGKARHGVGFVVGTYPAAPGRKGLLILTAQHTIRENDGDAPQRVVVRDEMAETAAKALVFSAQEDDFALLEAEWPQELAWVVDCLDPRLATAALEGDPVYWFDEKRTLTPARPAVIHSVAGDHFVIKGASAVQGDSGSPVFGPHGIVGMIRESGNSSATAVTIRPMLKYLRLKVPPGHGLTASDRDMCKDCSDEIARLVTARDKKELELGESEVRADAWRTLAEARRRRLRIAGYVGLVATASFGSWAVVEDRTARNRHRSYGQATNPAEILRLRDETELHRSRRNEAWAAAAVSGAACLWSFLSSRGDRVERRPDHALSLGVSPEPGWGVRARLRLEWP